MDDIKLILPCGYTTSLKNLLNKPNTIKCVICGSHSINLEECFRLPKNRFSMKQKESEIEIDEFKRLKKKLNTIRKNPNAYIEKSFERILTNLDQRRKEIKRELEKKVDEHYMVLYKKIIREKTLVLNEFEETSRQVVFMENINKSLIKSEKDFMKKIQSIEDLLNEIQKNKSEILQLISIADRGDSYQIVNKHVEVNINNLEDSFGKITLNGAEIELNNLTNEKKEENSVYYQQMNSLNGHENSITCLDMYKNNLYSGSFDKTIKLWNREKSECLKTVRGITGLILCIKVLDDDLLASGSDDCYVRIWSIQAGTFLKKLTGHTDWILCLKSIRNGLLISGSVDKSIKIWDYRTGFCVKTLEGHERAVNCLEESENGKIISSSEDKSIKIWSPISELVLKNLEGHTGSVNALKILNKNKMVSGSWDKTIRLWQIETGECLKIFHGHTKGVTCVDIIDDEFLVSGSWDATIKIWNLNSGDCVKSIQTNLINIKNLIFTKDEIICCGDDKNINIWRKMYNVKL